MCSLAGMGVTLVEKRQASLTAGDGCDVAGQSVNAFGGQRGHEQVCDPAGLEPEEAMIRRKRTVAKDKNTVRGNTPTLRVKKSVLVRG